MYAMKYFIYSIILIILVTGFLFSGSFLYKPKFELSANMTALFDFLGGNSALKTKIRELEIENENLKVEKFNNDLALPDTVKVYSVYPFNNIKEIAIADGKEGEQKVGQIITYGKNILVGKIKEVFRNHSVVTTIFDPNLKIEVRVGENEADGLFTGGNVLKLSLLSKKADIKEGDIVVTAAKGYPYGLEIGRVKEIRENLSSPLKEAILMPIIQLEDLRNVSVHK